MFQPITNAENGDLSLVGGRKWCKSTGLSSLWTGWPGLKWKLKDKMEQVKKHAVLQLLSLQWLIEVSTALWKWDVSLLNIILIRLRSRTHKHTGRTTYAVCDDCKAYSYHICRQTRHKHTSITVKRAQAQTPQTRLKITVSDSIT